MILAQQTAHGFAKGDWLRQSGPHTFAKALADTAAHAAVLGVVTEVISGDRFRVATNGDVVGLPGNFIDGTTYFLSATVAGAMAAAAPTLIVPVFTATSARGGVVMATAAESTIRDAADVAEAAARASADTAEAVARAAADTAEAVARAAADATLQPLDAELTALAGLTSAADKGIYWTGSAAAGTYDLTAAGRTLMAQATAALQRSTLGSTTVGDAVFIAATAAAARTALGLVIGTDVAAQTHASQHKSAGSDAIKIDELAAPTDVTTLNASISAHGLLKKLDNDATHYMDGTGNWSAPAGGGGGGGAFTAEDAQDAVGGILSNTATITFTYNDAGNDIHADVNTASITNAMSANMAAHTFKMRNTNSTGAPEDGTAAQVAALLPAFVASGASHAQGLVPDPGASAGTTKFLREDATFAVPAATAYDSLSTLVNAESAITGAASPTTFDTLYKCTGTSADYTVTLPAVSGNGGKMMGFRGGTSAELTKVVTIDGNGTEKIQTARLTIALLWDEVLWLYCDGTQWWIISHVHAGWQAFTPTITGVTGNPGKGTSRTELCSWRRIGQMMHISFFYQQTSAGTSGTGAYKFLIPGGFSADTTIHATGDLSSASTTPGIVGSGLHASAGTLVANPDQWCLYNATNMFLINTGANIVGSTFAPLGNTNMSYSGYASIAISGW